LDLPKFLGLAFCAVALMASSPSYAAGGDAGTVTITRFQVWVNGDILIYAANFSNPDGCTLASRVVVPSTAANFNLLMAMLYDAYANGDPVDFYVKGCSTEGNYTDPIVGEFTLAKS